MPPATRLTSFGEFWSTQWDSSPRPQACKDRVTPPLCQRGVWRPIGQIEALTFRRVLRSLECRERFESARRLRSAISDRKHIQIRDRHRPCRNRPDRRPARCFKTQVKATPRAAITDAKKFGALLRAIGAFDGQPGTRIALQLLDLSFPRPGELRLAHWTEFDL